MRMHRHGPEAFMPSAPEDAVKNGLQLLVLLGSVGTMAADPVKQQPITIRPDDLKWEKPFGPRGMSLLDTRRGGTRRRMITRRWSSRGRSLHKSRAMRNGSCRRGPFSRRDERSADPACQRFSDGRNAERVRR